MASPETPDLFTNLGILFASIVAALSGYFGRNLLGKAPAAKADPVLTSIGLALGDKDQTERILSMLERIAKALEVMSDRKQNDIQESLDELLVRLDRAEKEQGARTRRRT